MQKQQLVKRGSEQFEHTRTPKAMASLSENLRKHARQVLKMDGGAIGQETVWEPGLGDNANKQKDRMLWVRKRIRGIAKR